MSEEENKVLELSDAQHLESLKNLLKVAEGLDRVEGFDDTTIGDKSTWVNTGLCCDSIKVYPKADMHLWPELFPGRIAPKYRDKGQYCPLDYKGSDQKRGMGCFYSCQYFSKGLRDIGVAVKLIRERIEEVEG